LRHRLQIPLVLFLCFMATGAQWDLLQMFAWGRMMAGHAQTMPLSRAVAKTFDGEMCAVCRMVADAKKQDRARSAVPEPKGAGRIFLFFQAAPKIAIEPPGSTAWRPGEATVASATRSAPPSPPPRLALA